MLRYRLDKARHRNWAGDNWNEQYIEWNNIGLNVKILAGQPQFKTVHCRQGYTTRDWQSTARWGPPNKRILLADKISRSAAILQTLRETNL